jgi:hypothetical protein
LFGDNGRNAVAKGCGFSGCVIEMLPFMGASFASTWRLARAFLIYRNMENPKATPAVMTSIDTAKAKSRYARRFWCESVAFVGITSEHKLMTTKTASNMPKYASFSTKVMAGSVCPFSRPYRSSFLWSASDVASSACATIARRRTVLDGLIRADIDQPIDLVVWSDSLNLLEIAPHKI